jgi:hypothetical protein
LFVSVTNNKMSPELQERITRRKLCLSRHLELLREYERLKDSIELQKQLLIQCKFILGVVKRD